MTKLLTHPKNPVCETNNKPRELGETRYRSNGRLQYKNPMTGSWENAIRLHNIRAKLLQEAHPSQYTFPKKDGNKGGKHPTNYTSFLLKDKDVGPLRANRPDVLFKIFKNGQHSAEPTGYLMDEGRIVLDAFDHGIRDFPHLPKLLSSELEGHDIEYYYRQNAETTDYDLIARMPNGYWGGKGGKEWKEPRGGTVNQRAQRYRGMSALISWNQREGTKNKNDYILSLIPAWCKNPAVNSTKNFRDLEKDEKKAAEKQNEGKMLSRARNAKKEDKKDTKKDLKKNGKKIDKKNSKKASKTEEESSAEEDYDEEAIEEYYDEDSAEDDHGKEDNDGWDFNEVADAYEAQAEEEAALESSHSESSFNGSLLWPAGPHSSTSSSNGDLGCPFTRKTVAGKTVVGKTVPGHTYAGKTVPGHSYAGKTVPGYTFAGKTLAKTSFGFNTYGKRSRTHDAEDPADDSDIRPSKHPHVVDNSEAANTSADSALQQRATRRSKPTKQRSFKSLKAPRATSGNTFDTSLAPAVLAPLPISNPGQVGGVVSHTYSVDTIHQQAEPPIMNSKRKQDAPEDSNEPEQENPSKRTKANEVLPPPQAASRSTQSVHTAMDRRNATIRQHKRAKNATTPRSINSPAYSIFGYVSPAAENLDPELDQDFQAEAQAGIERGDYRYISPTNKEEEEAISQALELTRVNFHNLKGSIPPQDLNDYKDESYASQFRRLQQHHTKKWMGELPALPLYSLPAWYRGFDKWRTACPQGRSLNDQERQAKKSHAALMKEIDAEES